MKFSDTRFTAILFAAILIITFIVCYHITENLQCFPFSTAIHGSDGLEKEYVIDSSCQIQVK